MDTEIWIQKTPQSINRYLFILLVQTSIPFLPPLEESVWVWSTGDRNAGCLGHMWRVALCCPAGMLSQGPWADCASTKAHLDAQCEPSAQESSWFHRTPQQCTDTHRPFGCGTAVAAVLSDDQEGLWSQVSIAILWWQEMPFKSSAALQVLCKLRGGKKGKDFVPYHTIRSAIHYY